MQQYFTADVQSQGRKWSSEPRREEVITAGKWVDVLTGKSLPIISGIIKPTAGTRTGKWRV